MKRFHKINLILSPLLLLGFVLTAFAWQKLERENTEMKNWIECLDYEAENLFGERYIATGLHSRAEGISATVDGSYSHAEGIK